MTFGLLCCSTVRHHLSFCAIFILQCLQVSAVVKESCEGVTQAAITRAQALTRAQHAATTAAAAGVVAAPTAAAAAAAAGDDDDDANAAVAAIDSTANARSSESQKAGSTQQQQHQQQQQQCGFVWAQIRVSPEQTLRDHYNAEAAAAAKEDACAG
jgi:hypothetical protein